MEQICAEYQPATWRAFQATALDGRSAEDVAAELGMSVAAVYTAKSRVTARLGKVIEELESDA
jgi:RNA polymerase sigma-70 factor (ECF subfamily)